MDNRQTSPEKSKDAPGEEVTLPKIYKELRGIKEEAKKRDRKHSWEQVVLVGFSMFLVAIALLIPSIPYLSPSARLYDAGFIGIFGIIVVFLARHKLKRIR